MDALQITRELRRRGVGVLSLNASLDTRTNDGELRLTIMSSFAQAESRRSSERSKWGQMRSMEKGVGFGGSLLGYDVPSVFEGRGAREAAGMGVEIGRGEMVMRCNLITVEQERIRNHSAGHISTAEAAELIDFARRTFRAARRSSLIYRATR